jgi:pimeloyl-ACP methyl ester carboxylesterase
VYVVEDDGPPDRPLVVLVHGTLDRSTGFARVRRELREFRVVAYDRRGYARSRDVQPAATGIEEHVDDLLAVLAGRPAVVVGHSYGADVTLTATTRPGTPIRGVVAYEPPMTWLPDWPRDTAGAAAVRAAVEAGDTGAAAEWFLRRMAGDEAWERLPERTKAERRAEGATLVAELRSIRDEAPFDPAEVAVPVVVGCGTSSAEHHRRATEALARALPHGELVLVEGAAHGAHLSHPCAFADLIRRVVSST